MVRSHNSSLPPVTARSIETKGVALPEGRVRCPACGGTPKVLKSGRLSKHSDRRGVECPHKTYGREVDLTDLPPIMLPSKPSLKAPKKPRPVDDRPRADGTCHECGRSVSGERWYCGPCLARRI